MSKQTDIIFDMDGVIFDTENLFLDCWRQIATTHGLAGIDTVYHRVLGMNGAATRAVYREAYGADFDYEGLSRAAMDIFNEQVATGGMPMKPGVVELLTYLRDGGYRLGLASSTSSRRVISQLESRDLLKFFRVVIGGEMVQNSKPAPDIFLLACERIGVNPAAAYAIEDSYNGVRAAHAAGMRVIMVPDMVMPDDEMRSLATHIFPDLLAVRAYLVKLNILY